MEPAHDIIRVRAEFDPLLAPVPIRASSVRSRRASISDASDQSVSGLESSAPQWLPLALRWYFMLVSIGSALVLSLATAILHNQSQKHKGLGSVDSAILGWRFYPTLVAVIYTQLTAMLLGAVKRTEPFARLANPIGNVPDARFTLLEKSKPWWTTLARGFQTKRSGGNRSWAIILSCIIFILATLAISPLSAALLIIEEIQITTQMSLSRFALNKTMPIRPQTERSTYLRTMTALLQNYSSSPWVMDDFFVSPFWPETESGSRWAPLSPVPQLWDAETTIFHTNFSCDRLENLPKNKFMTERGNDTWQDTWHASTVLEFAGGCQVTVSTNGSGSDSTKGLHGIASWSIFEHLVVGDMFDTDSLVSSNGKCRMDELIMITTPMPLGKSLDQITENLTITAYACRSDHFMATLPVRASATPAGVSISFDRSLYHQTCEIVPPEILNMSMLHNSYTDPAWHKLVPQPSFTDYEKPDLSGTTALLGTKYAFDPIRMMTESTIPETAARLRRRFFAEIMQTSLQDAPVEAVLGTRLVKEQRIVVNFEVAATLSALLAFSFLALLALLGLSRLSNRPLNLRNDPSSVLGLCALINSNTSVLSTFSRSDLSSREELKAELAARVFATSLENLYELPRAKAPDHNNVIGKVSRLSSSTLPALRIRNLLGLFIYILTLLIAIVVVQGYAQASNLRQGLFTYRAKLTFLGEGATFSPFAILPTLFAVGVTLWWDTIDIACRTLQPYLAISRRPQPPSCGITLSYASSFWVWASLKAIMNRHWLLSLITISTFWLQALTIAMSALFQHSSGMVSEIVDIQRPLEIRRDPFVYQFNVTSSSPSSYNSAGYYPEIVTNTLSESFTGLETNWMYTAMIQAAFNGSEPPWSQKGWSFVPVSLDHHQMSQTAKNDTDLRSESGPELNTVVSLTLRTAALRARIECTAVQSLTNISLWLSHRINETDGRTFLNYVDLIGLKEFYVPYTSIFGGNESTPFIVQASFPQCCANLTNPTSIDKKDMPVAVAYWTGNSASKGNFTVKWLRGNAGYGPVYYDKRWGMFFPTPPRLQALNCMPIIETADAEVTLDPRSGIIESYKILNQPVSDDVAWSDEFVMRNFSEWEPRFRNSTEIKEFYSDVTTSYGTMFLKSFLGAADLSGQARVRHSVPKDDNLGDFAFNMRDSATGLNLDFMSYAMYTQVNMDPVALLDADILLQNAQKVFSMFFQHFVSSQTNLESGGRAYQPIGFDLQVPPPRVENPSYVPDGRKISTFENMPSRNTSRKDTATLNTRVNVLQVNRIAFWLSVSIMIWLLVVLIVVMLMQRQYYGRLLRSIECIADVLVLIAGSKHLLAAIEEIGIDALKKEDSVLTSLDWFRDPDGTMRWRIEIVQDAEIRLLLTPSGPAYASVPTTSSTEIERT